MHVLACLCRILSISVMLILVLLYLLTIFFTKPLFETFLNFDQVQSVIEIVTNRSV